MIFVKLKFLFLDKATKEFKLMGNFTNPNLFEKIIAINSFWDERDLKVKALAFSASQVTLYQMELNKKQQIFEFIKMRSQKLFMGEETKTFDFKVENKPFVLASDNIGSTIYQIREDNTLEKVATLDLSPVITLIDKKDLLLACTNESLTILNKETLCVEN